MRLRLKSDFERIKQTGRGRNAGPLIVSTLRRETPGGGPRLGLVVSRRVGKAIVRNRVKRRLRAIFRETAPALDPSCDYVVIARRAAAEVSYAELASRFKGAAPTRSQPYHG